MSCNVSIQNKQTYSVWEAICATCCNIFHSNWYFCFVLFLNTIWIQNKFFKYSLNINEFLIFSSRNLFFFSTQLQLKIPMFELNHRFVFNRILTVDIQSIIEFLQLVHDYLVCGIKVRSPVYMYRVVSVNEVPLWPSD